MSQLLTHVNTNII